MAEDMSSRHDAAGAASPASHLVLCVACGALLGIRVQPPCGRPTDVEVSGYACPRCDQLNTGMFTGLIVSVQTLSEAPDPTAH